MVSRLFIFLFLVTLTSTVPLSNARATNQRPSNTASISGRSPKQTGFVDNHGFHQTQRNRRASNLTTPVDELQRPSDEQAQYLRPSAASNRGNPNYDRPRPSRSIGQDDQNSYGLRPAAPVGQRNKTSNNSRPMPLVNQNNSS